MVLFSLVKKNHFLIALTLTFVLSSCATFQSIDTIAEQKSLEFKSSPEAVISSLVKDAVKASEKSISTEPKEPKVNDSLDEGSVEVVGTTIPMTPNRLVERTINNMLQNNRTVLRIWAERSHIYFPMIEKIFAEEGVPDELKYLAIGESGLNPTITSRAGAVGMWQFMKATGRSEGLRIDEWVDERRDPELSTRAAAKHLKKLNQDYNGRWHLALAGYNCSYRCITRAIRRAGYNLNDNPTYWDVYPHLPQETRGFVPKFIANALLLSNPTQYGIEVDYLGEELAYDEISIIGMLAIEDAASLAGTDVPTIRQLNPALLRSTLPGDGKAYVLRIPRNSFERFLSNFEQQKPVELKGHDKYIVRSGDTLGAIARSHNTTVKELQLANNIKGSLIRINQELLIPGTAQLTSIEILSETLRSVAFGNSVNRPIPLSDEFELVEQAGSTPDKPLLAVSLRQPVQVEEGVIDLIPTIYKVKSGDTLGKIAQQFGVSVVSIQANNDIKGSTIFPNQELTIHSAARTLEGNVAKVITYRVKKGDNLYMIARRFNKSVDQLKRLNSLNTNLIHPGQSLRVD
jgi:membrane-bound lytic murein transglycosylase D